MLFEDKFPDIANQIINSEYKARSYISLYINDKYIDFFKKIYSKYPTILSSINISPNILNYILTTDSVEIIKFFDNNYILYDKELLKHNIKLYEKNKLYNIDKLINYFF